MIVCMMYPMKSPAREPIPFLFKPPYALFAFPAGNYRAVLRTVTTEEDEYEEGKFVIRFVLDVVAGEKGPVNYSVCFEYSQDEEGQKKLNDDLAAFLDRGEIDQMLGMPHEVDLLSFIGDEVDITVATFTSDDEPHYSTVTGVYPAGSLITGEMMALDEDRLAAQARKKWETPLEGSSLTVISTTASGRNHR